MTNEAEITLEANPDTFCRNKMKDFKNAGINRASLGVQSFFDKNLRFLSRSYGEKQSVAAAEIVAQTFENFSFDFIYGYEGQTVKNFAQDLERAVNFECKHISCYQLTFEENTPFYEKMLAGVIKKIDENKEIELYDYIEDFLENNNIFRYESSNYSMAGFESRHNLAYWKYEDYLGVGPSAHSRVVVDKRKTEMVKISDPFLWESALSQNRSTFSHINTLSEKEKLEEMIIMGLRMVNGVTMEDLYQKVSPRVVNEIISEKKLKFLTEKKLMANGKIQLTKSGLKKMNSAVKFLLS
jgi:oxygen-independent coproporphyrinogen-3 oxidase